MENNYNLYTINGEKVINSSDFIDGTLCYEVLNNIKYFYVIKNAHIYKLEGAGYWVIDTYKYIDGKWELVANNYNPYDLIEEDILHDGDIVKFKNTITNEDLQNIPELNLFDPAGIFIIGESFDDYSIYMKEELLHDHDDNCDDDFDYDEEDLSIISACSILEYLRYYEKTIKSVGSIIDEMK